MTASQVGVLMNGTPEQILNLWRMHVGDPNYVEPTLDDIWAVQLGSCTETLNLDWYAQKSGHRVTRRGEVVTHPNLPWAACTLDGWEELLAIPVEAKHVNGFSKIDEVTARYQPQLHWQMLCTDSARAILSVIVGAKEPELVAVDFDNAYGLELLGRAKAFWACVEGLTPPVALPALDAPVPQSEWRELDMQGSNEWGAHAGAWLENQDAAKTFEGSAKSLKALVAEDVGKAFGYGICASRAKNGAITIRKGA